MCQKNKVISKTDKHTLSSTISKNRNAGIYIIN